MFAQTNLDVRASAVTKSAVVHTKGGPKKKQPSHRLHSVSALEKKYQWTLGEIEALENAQYEWVGIEGYKLAMRYWRDRLTTLNLNLAVLERSIRFFDPKWERKAFMVPKKRCASPPSPTERTEFLHALWRALRSQPEPILKKDIVEAIAADLTLSIQRSHQREALFIRVGNTLARYRKKGFVNCIGEPARWFELPSNSQADRDFRPPQRS